MQPTLPEKPIRKPRTKASSRRRAVLEEGRSNLHITRLFPNIVTILALCFGLSAMRYALSDRWELSVSFIVIAAILDGLDGRLARLLNATSDFGAHLDSLVDFVNFGVAPAFVLYLWGMHEIRAFGWGIALFYSICCVIRLARFNTTLEEDEPPFWFDYFFSGVPSPIGALLALAPLIAVIGLKDESPEMLAQINWLINPFSVCPVCRGNRHPDGQPPADHFLQKSHHPPRGGFLGAGDRRHVPHPRLHPALVEFDC